MRNSRLLPVLAAFAAVAVLAADASAMYHPTLGRFLQRDPIGYADGMGLYEYVGEHPVSGTDPIGLRTQDEIKQAGLQSLAKLADQAVAKCDQCCCPGDVQGCKDEAKAMAQMIRAAWEFNFGRSGQGDDDQRGGYYCWDWSRAFAASAQFAQYALSKLIKDHKPHWRVNEAMARPSRYQQTGERTVHYYAKLEACPGKMRKEGAKDCTLMVDDGYLTGGYVHDGLWPETGAYSEMGERGQSGFVPPEQTRGQPDYSSPPIVPPGKPHRGAEEKEYYERFIKPLEKYKRAE